MTRRRYHRQRTRVKRSGLEDALAAQLSGLKIQYEYEPFYIEYTPARPRRYTPDFVLPNGIIIEAKGYFESSDRSKMIAVRDQHPDLAIRFVFGNADARLSKTSKTSYGKWATKKGFKWADMGTIPTRWLNETRNEVSLAAIAALKLAQGRTT